MKTNRMAEMPSQDNILENILLRLAQVESRVNVKKSDLSGEYLTPKEVCEILRIGRTKFYSWVADGYLHPMKPDPKGRKSYILKSEISAMFPKVLAFQ
jgi:excisionase family DNA binding protein